MLDDVLNTDDFFSVKQKYAEDYEGLQGARSLRRVKLGKHKGKENNTRHSAKSCFQVWKKHPFKIF